MKRRKLAALALTAAMTVGCTLSAVAAPANFSGVLNPFSLTAYAAELNDNSTRWEENSTITGNVTINENVEVDNDMTLTIPEGMTLTVNGAIYALSCTLTVTGTGTLIVNGRNGDPGEYGSTGFVGNLVVDGAKVEVTGGNGGHGVIGDGGDDVGDGGKGVFGDVIVDSGSVTVTGGNGGDGAEDDGGTGGEGVSGSITINSGSATVTGGNGGGAGDYGSVGNVGQAVVGTITSTSTAEESGDGENWDDISGDNSTKRYVRTKRTEPQEQEPKSDYMITIPATLTVANAGWNELEGGITATGSLAKGKKLVVSAASENEWHLVANKGEENVAKVGYNLAMEGNDESEYNATAEVPTWEFTALTTEGTKQTAGIIVEDYSNKPAGIYEDTVTFTASLEDAAPANPYAANNVGDVVEFGSYNWYIIDKRDDGVTLLMQATLPTKKAYNDDYKGITWEECSLHDYLNGEFYNGDGFSDADRAMIALTSNSNPNNGGISGGNDTEDYIYLLSIDEASALDSSIRSCDSRWWLRSPGGDDSDMAAVVDAGGYVDAYGHIVDEVYAVRPALNLKFNDSGTADAGQQDAPAQEIQLDTGTADLTLGSAESDKTKQIGVVASPTETVTWSSADPSVATVDETGKVTAIALGSTTITAKSGDVTASCTVNVYQKVTITNNDSLPEMPAAVKLKEQQITKNGSPSRGLDGTNSNQISNDFVTVTFEGGTCDNDGDDQGWYFYEKNCTTTVTAKPGYAIKFAKFSTKEGYATLEKAPFTVYSGDDYCTYTEPDNEGENLGYWGVNRIEVVLAKLNSLSVDGMAFYYCGGETWREAIANHPENAEHWLIEDNNIWFIWDEEKILLIEENDSKFSLVSPDALIDAKKTYRLNVGA